MSFSDSHTTFIIGAGASKEVNLPIGKELKSKIAPLLDIKFKNGDELISGSFEIVHAFEEKRLELRDFTRTITWYLEAAWQIRDAMAQAISIDNYIDAHVGNKEIEFVGKLAIARAILEAEQKSWLRPKQEYHSKTLFFLGLEDTWYNKFFQLITENCQFENLEKNFSKITVISFNYDRCLEHFMFYAIQNYYGVDSVKAASVMHHFTVFYPYGNVGSLPWQNTEKSTKFGADLSGKDLLDRASQLRSFAEGTDPTRSDVTELRKYIKESGRLVFLGFAYHSLNMQLLTPDQEFVKERSILGTAFGISEPDCNLLKQELSMFAGNRLGRVHLRNDLTCSKLFDEYRRSLSM